MGTPASGGQPDSPPPPPPALERLARTSSQILSSLLRRWISLLPLTSSLSAPDSAADALERGREADEQPTTSGRDAAPEYWHAPLAAALAPPGAARAMPDDRHLSLGRLSLGRDAGDAEGDDRRVVYCNEPVRTSSKAEQRADGSSSGYADAPPRAGGGYAGNGVTTSKYSAASFLPRALFEQFRRFANVYFLAIAALSLAPFSPSNPVSHWVPLALVVALSVGKEGLEDRRRRRLDAAEHGQPAEVLVPAGGGVCMTQRWEALRCGDVVVVRRDGAFPADMVLLCTSSGGDAFVSTSGIDGESALKAKTATGATSGGGLGGAAALQAIICCERPSPSLYTFQGSLRLGRRGAERPLGVGNLVLRGSVLRSTDWAAGAVVYAGNDCKALLSHRAPRSKRSFIEGRLDRVVVATVLFMVALCCVGAISLVLRGASVQRPQMWYLLDTSHEMEGGTTARAPRASRRLRAPLTRARKPPETRASGAGVRLPQQERRHVRRPDGLHPVRAAHPDQPVHFHRDREGGPGPLHRVRPSAGRPNHRRPRAGADLQRERGARPGAGRRAGAKTLKT